MFHDWAPMIPILPNRQTETETAGLNNSQIGAVDIVAPVLIATEPPVSRDDSLFVSVDKLAVLPRKSVRSFHRTANSS